MYVELPARGLPAGGILPGEHRLQSGHWLRHLPGRADADPDLDAYPYGTSDPNTLGYADTYTLGDRNLHRERHPDAHWITLVHPEPHAHTYGNSIANPHPDIHGQRHTYAYAHTHKHNDLDRDGLSHAHPHSDGDFLEHSHGNTLPERDGDRNRYGDAFPNTDFGVDCYRNQHVDADLHSRAECHAYSNCVPFRHTTAHPHAYTEPIAHDCECHLCRGLWVRRGGHRGRVGTDGEHCAWHGGADTLPRG